MIDVTALLCQGRRRGVVDAYDNRAGYGTISDSSGQWWFHCTAIADGSRHIDQGVEVCFDLKPGHRGMWEATSIEPAPPQSISPS